MSAPDPLLAVRELCGRTWDNADVPDLPHRCAIRAGWHLTHCCHCGATLACRSAERTVHRKGTQQ